MPPPSPVATMPAPELAPKPKNGRRKRKGTHLTDEKRLAYQRAYSRRRREEAKAAKAAQEKDGETRREEMLEAAARAQSLASKASAPAQRQVQQEPPPKSKFSLAGGLIISLPDMETNQMDFIEKCILDARKQLDEYSKQAQTLRMAGRDRTCHFCGKKVLDGQWYARDCKPASMSANGLVRDLVWCSQSCQIQSVLHQQNEGQGLNPSDMEIKIRNTFGRG
jgi:hypothetical protein